MQRDLGYVVDIVLACRDLLEFTSGFSRSAPEADKRTQYAAVRCIEIIGEATKRVSPAFRATHPQVPWQSMAGMRDRLVHQYDHVDLDVVWEVVERDVPALLGFLESLAPPEEST